MQTLLAAVLLAAAQAQSAPPQRAPRKPPPAQLVVPDSVRKARRGDSGPPVASALASAEVLAALPPFTPRAGAWAEYRILERGQLVQRIRLSVLPPALEKGRYWLEIAAVSPGAFPIATRLLLRGPPERPDSIERALLWVAGQPPLELPVEEAEDTVGKPPRLPASKVQKLSPATLTVPAGKFQAGRIQVREKSGTTTLWTSPAVPLYGLLQVQQASRVVELAAYGNEGAHSLIPGQGEPDEPAGAPITAAPRPGALPSQEESAPRETGAAPRGPGAAPREPGAAPREPEAAPGQGGAMPRER